jgi:hypothetical protein
LTNANIERPDKAALADLIGTIRPCGIMTVRALSGLTRARQHASTLAVGRQLNLSASSAVLERKRWA